MSALLPPFFLVENLQLFEKQQKIVVSVMLAQCLLKPVHAATFQA
jgi:hypothetical protein